MNVSALENGPILIEVDGNKLALCRCGDSENKPFCDGAHVACEFREEAVQVWPELTEGNES